MKADNKLLRLFIGDTTLKKRLIRDSQLSLRECHPGIPSAITRPVQRVFLIPLAGADTDEATAESIHSATAHMGLIAFRPTKVVRYDSAKRTLCAAIRFEGWHLNFGNVTFWHKMKI